MTVASTIPVIKQMRDDWRAAANSFLKGNGTTLGGRQSELRQDGPPPKENRIPAARVPTTRVRQAVARR